MSGRSRGGSRIAAGVLALLAVAHRARAQEFAALPGGGPRAEAASLLADGLGVPAGAPSLESAFTRWFAMPGFETHAFAAALPVRSASVAAGVATTGDPELGWNACALAFGGAGPGGGAALRAIARRDRAAGTLGLRGLGEAAGWEAGGGAWLAPTPGTCVWVSAPQMWVQGRLPPLVRPLTFGIRAAFAGGEAWASLAAPARDDDDGARSAGVGLAQGPLEAWLEARDGPLRGAAGLRARLHAFEVAYAVEPHPVLGETTRLSIAWRAAGR